MEQVAEDIYNKRETGLRILTQAHIAHGLIGRVLGEFDKIVKGIRFNVVIRPRKDLTKWIGGHQFDLAFTLLPASHPLVRHKKLVTVKLLVALPKESPFAQKSHITIKELSAMPIIALPKGLPMRHRLHELFENTGFDPAIRIETPTVLSACQMVSQGLGATLTGPFTASLFSKKNFVLRPFAPEYLISYGILHLKQEQPRLLVRRFMDVSIKVAQKIRDEVMGRL
jgi:DNA-binding transcriptional LysR family regulator